jgi:hypothetical protein
MSTIVGEAVSAIQRCWGSHGDERQEFAGCAFLLIFQSDAPTLDEKELSLIP